MPFLYFLTFEDDFLDIVFVIKHQHIGYLAYFKRTDSIKYAKHFSGGDGCMVKRLRKCYFGKGGEVFNAVYQ